MMKMPKLLIVYLLIAWPIIMFFLITTSTGKVSISYDGFAIDNNSNIYLGKNSAIEVLNYDGKILRNISPYTSRGYKFTITSNNQIKISTGNYLYLTDLSGNLISKKEITDYKDDELISVNRYKFVTSDGTQYVMKNHFLRTCIYQMHGKQKTIVYKMPVFDYIVKLLIIACFLGLIIIVPIVIFKSRRTVKS